MKWIKLFEKFDIGNFSSNVPPQNLEEQIAFSMKWYPSLYDSKYGRIKVLSHMYLSYGTEYEWVDGKLENVYPDLNNDSDMYEYRYREWENKKGELEERLEEEMDHYEEILPIVSKSSWDVNYVEEDTR